MPDLTETPFCPLTVVPSDSLATAEVFTGKGVLLALSYYNSTEVTVYLQKFDRATAPVSEGTVPSFPPIPVAAGGLYESDAPFGCELGCWIGTSSTAAIFTESEGAGFIYALGQK